MGNAQGKTDHAGCAKKYVKEEKDVCQPLQVCD